MEMISLEAWKTPPNGSKALSMNDRRRPPRRANSELEIQSWNH
jgi:hypothetical protein